MFAVCVIGDALDDISPRDGTLVTSGAAVERAQDALVWCEGAPAAFPCALACAVARVPLATLRAEAEQRALRRWPALEATVAA